MSPRAIQQAPFRVLVGANMPAVLVEMGFLTNAAAGEAARRPTTFQNAVVQALVDAITRFRDGGAATGGARRPRRRAPDAAR